MPEELVRVERKSGALLARSATFVRQHRHGVVQLADVAHADTRAFVVLTRDLALEAIDLERALYLDTETSGLAGGSGTYVFMVGLGSFEGGGFHVWQGFLDDPAHERTLLVETAERIRSAPAVVSFFGKSFDRHRLEDRMRCLGIEPPFEGRPHLDLYHPLRRLYRGVFRDHRLRTLENALCGLEREDDLPGSLAPAAWFDFLAGRPHSLEGVFRHNRDDVLSLVTLAAHLGSILHPASGAVAATAELADLCAANLARSMARAGDPRSGLNVCDEVLARGTVDDRRARELRVLRAGLLGTNEDRAGSAEALRELAREAEDEHSAGVLLALARCEIRALGDPRAARAILDRAAVVIAGRQTGLERARSERVLTRLRASFDRKLALAARRSTA